MRVLVFCWFIVLMPEFVTAQFDKSYTPVPVQDTIPSEIHHRMSKRLEYDKSQVTEPQKKINTYLKSLYDEQFKYVVSNFNDDYIILDTEITPYLQQVLANIYKANPQLNLETTVYAYRSSVPNAFSFGDGTLAVTLGLLSRLENESQLAFILCHELAHYHRRHAETRMQSLAQLNYDKELEKKLKQSNAYTYKKEVLKNLELSITKHSRSHEFEADSVGLTYFLKTSYDRNAPVECMGILDKADEGRSQKLIDFKKYLSFSEYPFKESWLTYEKSTMWHKSEKDSEFGDSDTTHTHPNCQRRLAALKKQLQNQNSANTLVMDQAKIRYITTKSAFEEVASQYHFKKYGKALFGTFLLLEQYPDNAYLHAMVAKCFYQLYSYQKNHEIGKVLTLPDSRFDENYDRFLTFVHQLRLTELASLGYYYAEFQKPADATDEDFWYAYWLCSQLPVSKQGPAKVKAEYTTNFPKGKYLQSMN